MKNCETRPTSSAPLPEVNVTSYNDQIRSRRRGNDRGHGRGHGRGRGGGRGRGNGRNRGQGRGYGRVDSRDVTFKRMANHRKWHDNGNMKNFERDGNVKPNSCYRCGSINHWARACRTPKHLVELYEQYLKKGKKGQK
uniref:uncharacterized protein LOC122607051 n=1 Tax=Erigeron canadensis TaxID=72917 RepID=UPI001CB98530|nr:uncharacterized protein LOC122607051 [Erigeron canadensis]